MASTSGGWFSAWRGDMTGVLQNDRRAWRFLAFLTLICLAWAPPVATAQTGSATTIQGQITDENGGALPGVTGTLTGPALQGPPMTTVSDERGDDRPTDPH